MRVCKFKKRTLDVVLTGVTMSRLLYNGLMVLVEGFIGSDKVREM